MLRIANAPCSWGVLEFGLEGNKAGYQQVLDEIRETGYSGTELGDWGFLPTTPAELKAELRARELTLLAAFVPIAFKFPEACEKGIGDALRTARLLAAVEGTEPWIVLADDNGKDPVRTLNAGRIRPEQGLTAAEWNLFASNVQRVAQMIYQETGLRTVFHHHCAGFVETPDEIDCLMQMTDPKIVGLCFDSGHYRYAGGDPVSGIRKHADRIWHVHFKDHKPEVASRARAEKWDYFKAVRNGIFCELGQGDIDFVSIKAELLQMGYQGWIVVEQDVLPGMGSPRQSAERNREFLRRIGL